MLNYSVPLEAPVTTPTLPSSTLGPLLPLLRLVEATRLNSSRDMVNSFVTRLEIRRL